MNEFDQRCQRLRQKMQEASVDAYLVTSADNIYYLSGFTGDAGVLLVTEQERYLITDARFETQIAQTNPWLKAVITRDYFGQALELCERENIVALAFEESLSYQVYDRLDEYALCDLVALSGLIEALRLQKSTAEIEKIKASCRLAKDGFEHVLKIARPGLKEQELALELDYYMRKNGASQVSFETIVASGSRSALPHGVASNKKLALGDLVTLDYGYFLDHYTSDVTRTFVLGKVDPKLEEIYHIVSEAKQLTIEAVRPGITGKELDRIGRDYITQKGYGKYFEHGMGHGIGLNVHEGPYIGKTSAEVLQPGQVITIEPGIYLPGLGGVRLEDDILVTETGYENLTDFYQEYYEI
ncbi:Xaa-Pro peptidase family protein [uncultured Ligilactobacillus sp.]|uniref:M24 family metallopeptidase n=1 Tax=uncultured Ligilactobacillus sp. TaxID=2837633 RepID=UPI00272CD052|nr:aminopeptidase P family protein [uncultured Ligilactobacillus sp.]